MLTRESEKVQRSYFEHEADQAEVGRMGDLKAVVGTHHCLEVNKEGRKCEFGLGKKKDVEETSNARAQANWLRSIA